MVFFILGRCSPPVVDPNVIIEGDINCVEGSRISYHCQSGLEPTESKVSTCLSSGIWSPNPAEHNCTTQPDLGKKISQYSKILYISIVGLVLKVWVPVTFDTSGR